MARLKRLSGLRDEGVCVCAACAVLLPTQSHTTCAGQRLVSLSFAQTVQSSPQASAGDLAGDARRGGQLLEPAPPAAAAPSEVREGQWVVSTMAGFRTLAAAGFVEPQPSEAQRRGQKVRLAMRVYSSRRVA